MKVGATPFEVAVATTLEERLASLRAKSFGELRAIPDTTDLGAIQVEGRTVDLYLFSRKLRTDLVWIVALGAEKKWFGLFSRHIERGFEVGPTIAPRTLSSEELLLNGG